MYYFLQLDYSLAEPDYRFAATPFGELLRASGFSRTANQYVPPIGVVLVMSALLALTMPGFWRRVAYALLALVSAAAVALSAVRGMWLAAAAGLVLLPFLVKPRMAPLWILLALVATILALASGLASTGIQALASLTEGSVTARVDLIAGGLRAMLGSLNGTGIDNFGPVSPTFERYPVHNAPLQAAAELGVPGLLVFVALLAWVGWRLGNALRAPVSEEDRLRTKALFAGYVVLLIAIQAEPMAYSQFLWIYLALAEAWARGVRGREGAGYG
jgi:O-antigen ligase